MSHEMNAGIWRVDHTFQSNIRIKNIVENAGLSVTPVLYMADGTEYDLPRVELSPAGIATVNVNDALEVAPDTIRVHVSDFGSVSLRYQWHWAAAIICEIENLDVPRSLIYIHPFVPFRQDASQKPDVQQMDGLWWKRDGGVSGFVALTNVSDSPVQVKFSISDAKEKVSSKRSLSIAARNTRMVELADLFPDLPRESKEGGIRISYTGTPDMLIAVGGLENSREGYSSRIPLTMPGTQSGKQGQNTSHPAMANSGTTMDMPEPLNSSQGQSPNQSSLLLVTMAAVGIMVGAPDPMMMFPSGTRFIPYAVVRNTSAQTVKLNPTIYYMQGGVAKSDSLPAQVLPPNEARQLPLQHLLSDAGLGNFSGEINLTFSFTGEWKDLLLTVGSVDQTGNYVFEVDPAALGSGSSKVLSYWNAADGTDTMFSIWNHGDADEDLVLTLFYKDGIYKFPVHLAAKASAMFNISEIIQAHKPDADGNVIPFFIRQGSAKISGPNGEADTINATVGIATFNVHTKTCGVHCAQCSGVNDFFSNPNPLAAITGSSTQMTATAQYDTGTQRDVTSSSRWSSTNTPVATVSSGLVQGVSPGDTFIVAVDGLPVSGINCSSTGNPCPMTINMQAKTPGVVRPDHLVVQSDVTSVLCGTNGTLRRIITYSAVDVNGNSVGTISVKEHFASKGTNTCNTTINTTESCTSVSNGIMPDGLTVGCNSVGGSCGFTYTNQQWLYCSPAGTATVFATPGDLVVHNDSITVGGYASFPAGTKIFTTGIVF